ncbi:M28 family peptidase [Fluviispira multicolorata]|uniref:M28 family peptidase n=1 Tax=Fluviispira multicolorata TaxID=2654512 RepID=A0A833JDZ0_9BACT|nr:M28 family peptidase [Fluviispira multicolorata]KAB8032054.1 M28 family peptidase [Fluviispira multicolorata]
MKKTSLIWTILWIGLLGRQSLFASPLTFQNSSHFSEENMKKSLAWYTLNPHPMGSENQTKVAQTLELTLKKLGWKTTKQKFNTLVPNVDSEKFNGDHKNEKATKTINGYNIIGTLSGKEHCSLIIGGHYDTKYFKNFRFVGANDGGSSTIFMLELARLLKKEKFKAGTLGSCSISLVFFDGEEAFLPNWEEGKFLLGIQDNLYGSREFVNKYIHKKNNVYYFENRPINLTIILDMIGHKEQSLMITDGSNDVYSEAFIKSTKNTQIKKTWLSMEDDHIPFKELNLPFLHIIDWTNISEWHTAKDTEEIISFKNLADFGKTFLNFLSHKRLENGK